jgi:hypothetical protein
MVEAPDLAPEYNDNPQVFDSTGAGIYGPNTNEADVAALLNCASGAFVSADPTCDDDQPPPG